MRRRDWGRASRCAAFLSGESGDHPDTESDQPSPGAFMCLCAWKGTVQGDFALWIGGVL